VVEVKCWASKLYRLQIRERASTSSVGAPSAQAGE
jgi:hypothetical protein